MISLDIIDQKLVVLAPLLSIAGVLVLEVMFSIFCLCTCCTSKLYFAYIVYDGFGKKKIEVFFEHDFQAEPLPVEDSVLARNQQFKKSKTKLCL